MNNLWFINKINVTNISTQSNISTEEKEGWLKEFAREFLKKEKTKNRKKKLNRILGQ